MIATFLCRILIVGNHQVRETFSKKIRKYQQLSQMLFTEKGIMKAINIFSAFCKQVGQ